MNDKPSKELKLAFMYTEQLRQTYGISQHSSYANKIINRLLLLADNNLRIANKHIQDEYDQAELYYERHLRMLDNKDNNV